MGQIRLFQQTRRRYPESIPWDSVDAFCEALENQGPSPHAIPFLIKAETYHEGDGVYFIQTMESLGPVLEKLRLMERTGCKGFISQALIPAEGNVLRAVIMNHTTMTYWKRPRNPHTVITTVQRGAVIDPHWKKDLQDKGLTEANRFSRITGINLASMDFVFPLNEPDPAPFFLEINYYFGRRGLGGTFRYYGLLFQAIQEWLKDKELDPQRVSLV
jgi:ribosomal protein S6--L-glutamate ligase